MAAPCCLRPKWCIGFIKTKLSEIEVGCGWGGDGSGLGGFGGVGGLGSVGKVMGMRRASFSDRSPTNCSILSTTTAGSLYKSMRTSTYESLRH